MEVILFLLIVPLAVVAAIGGALWVLFKGVRWVLLPVLRAIGALVRHVGLTLWHIVRDALHAVGALITALVMLPLILGNLALGRTRSSAHYARACGDELVGFLLGTYRVALSHPLHLIGLGALLAGIERRLPATIDREPAARRPRPREFPGYTVTSSLPTGGSGADVLLAEPRRETRERWSEAGREVPERVVIKSFELERGSTLPQIVRESRALEAAGRLGLVYDHELADDRFWYVMEYVEGEELGLVVQHMHDRGGSAGLGQSGLRRILWWSRSLVGTLERFHAGGLWHKDVKPSNIIVDGARLSLVDFGLVTPLASTMTLTTHGTEYFRDPELVRLALQGVKVHEVDGVKFDLFSAGAVLYSMLENSFPAQGSLSRFSKPAPEALQWIVRRSMAEIDERYDSASEMLRDLEALDACDDPWAMLPADLPSTRAPVASAEPAPEPEPAFVAAAAAAGSSATHQPKPKRSPTRSAGQGRRRRAVAAAAVMGLGGLGAAGLLGLVAHGRSLEAHSAYAQALVSAPHLAPSEQESWDLAHEVLEAVGYERPRELELDLQQHTTQISSEEPEQHARTRRSLSLARELDGRPLVILSDVGAPVPRAALSEFEARLEAGGVEVLGTTLGELTPEEETAIAAAHHVAGVEGLGDRDAHARLSSWLAGQPNLGGVLWLSATDEPGRFRYLVLTQPIPNAQQNSAAPTPHEEPPPATDPEQARAVQDAKCCDPDASGPGRWRLVVQ